MSTQSLRTLPTKWASWERKWDHSGIAYDMGLWYECLRVLKPGGHLLSFGGSRTYHRMACAIEDAGFEIRDQIQWIYGSGFPKSHNLKGDREGWGTALKPAHEPIVVARKPLVGTVAQNVLTHGTGAINIDGCRVGEEVGRWPANIIHDGSEEVVDSFPSAPGQLANASTNSESRKTQNVYGAMKRGSHEESRESDNEGPVGFKMKPGARRLDAGSAARFFYCAKASKKDRGEGNTHPTVKPLALMKYLVRLVTPPDGVVLDPFMGSGTTGAACISEGFSFIGIEKDPAYFAIAEKRVRDAQQDNEQQAA